MAVPHPAICPDCRFQRRSLFRNEMMLYTRTCSKCTSKIISIYHPSLPYTVYCKECFEADTWDASDYAREYDEGRPFFEQFRDLMVSVPKRALQITAGSGPNVNSDYTNVASSNKNCYLIFNSSINEDSMYSRGIKNCRESVDTYFGVQMERCYEAVNVNEASGIVHGKDVTGCVDCIFALNLSGCTNCFGCVNLRGKSYYWFNEPLKKEEYERRLAQVRGSYAKMQEMRTKFEEFSLQFPRRENSNIKSVNSVGDYLFECKNSFMSFEQTACEDCRYGFSNKNSKDSYDILGYGYDSSLLLDCCATGLSSHVIGSYWAELSHDIFYSFCVTNCKDCFGCDTLENKQYAILNKVYPQAEYEALRAKIIAELTASGDYGLFFPPSVAPFAYNETVGQDNLPLSKEQATAYGYAWRDETQQTRGKETMMPTAMADRIQDTPDEITKEIFACTSCSRNYLVTPNELLFYKKMQLPLPRHCFYCRHADRLRRRGPMKVYARTCAKCQKAIQTTYAPDRPEIIYCEPCYQQEVV